MKICSLCKKELPLSSFYKKSDAKDGLHPNCKPCQSERDKRWRENNKEHRKEYERRRVGTEKHRQQARESYYRHRDAKIEYAKEYAQKNKVLTREIKSRYKARNPAKTLALTRKRQTQKMKAMPAWANEFFIEEAYHLARMRTQMTGFKWQVDHTVPLQSKLVCGLHCEANLAVIPASVNATKSNRYWPDMPT